MLHRAVLGSFERFIGVLIEHYAGKFPLWLAPVHVVVASVTTEANSYAEMLKKRLSEAGVIAELDDRNEKISYKVREHSLQKVPYILAVGKREADEGNVSVRRLGSPDQTVESFDTFFARICAEIEMPTM